MALTNGDNVILRRDSRGQLVAIGKYVKPASGDNVVFARDARGQLVACKIAKPANNDPVMLARDARGQDVAFKFAGLCPYCLSDTLTVVTSGISLCPGYDLVSLDDGVTPVPINRTTSVPLRSFGSGYCRFISDRIGFIKYGDMFYGAIYISVWTNGAIMGMHMGLPQLLVPVFNVNDIQYCFYGTISLTDVCLNLPQVINNNCSICLAGCGPAPWNRQNVAIDGAATIS